MFRFTEGEYVVTVADKYPLTYEEYCKHAKLVEIIGDDKATMPLFYLTAGKRSGWPFLMVIQTYHPGPESGFYPGVLLVPETGILFVGAGERLLCYTFDPLKRLWQDETWAGFGCWERHKDLIIMSAELELAAWDIHGQKRWTMFVEPPWYYTVDDNDMLHLDIMGRKSSFPVLSGPTSP